MIRILLMAVTMLVLQACASTPKCDKIRPYQQTAAVDPLTVPDDLSKPGMRSAAPEVEANAPVKRPDGGCLEDPPPFNPETASDDAN